MNKERFGQMMLILGEAFDTQITSTKTAIYFDALRDMGEENTLWAMQESIRRCKFFPRVAEIRELVDEQRAKEREEQRTERIVAENERRRIEAEEWMKDRRARKQLTGPSPIKAFVPKVLEKMSQAQIEARKQELQEQAKQISEKSDTSTEIS